MFVSHLLPVTGSKLLSSGLAFAFAVVVGRLLGPEQYGHLAVAFALTAVSAEVTGYGLETTLVRFGTRFLQEGVRGRVGAACRIVLDIKVLVNGGLLVTALLLARPVADLVGHPSYAVAIQAGIAGGLGLTLWRLSLSLLQTLRAFGTYALVQSANGVIKVGALALVLLLGRLTLPMAMAIHVASFLGGFLLGALVCPRDLLWHPRGERHLAGEIVHFSKWIVLASFFSILNGWLALLVLGYLVEPSVTGQFAAALTLISSIDILMVSLNTVLLPSACEVTDRASALEFTKRALSLSGLLSLTLLPLYLAAPTVFTVLFSSAFERAPDVFRILFWGFLVSLNVEPLVLVLYARNLPRAVTALEFGKFLMGLVACLALIPAYSLTGAATAGLLSRLAGGLLGMLAVYLVLRSFAGGLPAPGCASVATKGDGVPR